MKFYFLENILIFIMLIQIRILNSLVLIFVIIFLTIYTTKYFKVQNYVFIIASKEAVNFFDWSKCAKFGVFMPNNSNLMSKEEQLLAKWMISSNYWQKDIEKACFLVYFINKKSNLLTEHLPNDGMNSLIIFLNDIKPTEEFRKKNFRAIFVASDFNEGAFFPSVDIRLHFDLSEKKKQKIPMLFQKRKYLLSMQINEHNPSALYQHYHEKCAENVQQCQLFPSNEGSTFMLMLSSEKAHFVKKLNNALSSGAIPVFIDDSEERDLFYRLLPLPDLFEWHNAAIFLQHRTMDFQSLNSLLQNVPEWKIYELRRMGRFYFAHFLANPKVLLRTIFSAIRHRLLIVAPPEKIVAADVLLKLMPINGKTETKNLEREQIFNDDVKRLWNMDPTFLDSTSKVQPYWRHSHLQFNQQQINSNFYPKFEQKLSENWQNDEKFTIVLQAYRRDAQLLYTLKTLDGLRYLDRVIVIWGDFRRPITERSYAWPHIHVPIFVVNTSRDSLNDRFLPLSLIRTEAVLSIDDDFNVEHGTIEFSFRIWRENRARIVGPNYRIGYIQHNDNNDLIGIYKGPPRNEPIFQHCQYNIVLTSGAFIHRDFLASYSNEMPSEIRKHVDKITNCEDIAIAFWVSYLTRLGPLKTTQIGNTIGVFTKNTTGLSSRPDHFAQRSECIKLFSQILGHNPLVITEYRADSLLYKQKAEQGEGAENSKKCFKNE